MGLSTCDLSRGAAQAITLSSFAEAATKVLPKLTGLRVCESTVERTTERAGDTKDAYPSLWRPTISATPDPRRPQAVHL